MTRRKQAGLAATKIAVIAGAGAMLWLFRTETIGACIEVAQPAAISPDYRDIVIPPNLAPINLKILEPGAKFCLRISGVAGQPVVVFSGAGDMRIPARAWRALVEANRGGELRMDVYAKAGGGWRHFVPIRNQVTGEEIDPYVVYRFLPPVFSNWDRLSLRERDLRSFDEHILIDNQRTIDVNGRSIDSACINCHTFLGRRGSQMVLHVRPGTEDQVPAMVLARGGQAEIVNTGGPAAYASWHPSGKLLAYSRNSLVQMFHTAGVETREVVDRDSDLGVYRFDAREVASVPQISRADRLETFPAWAPDGRHLYFCSAPRWADQPNAVLNYDKVRYDLERIAYDAETGQWGQVETVVSAAAIAKSISLPQISPDGRYLMFCGHDYGSFPIFQPGSDLYLLDLSQAALVPRCLDELNSPRSDSYHSWSDNSRWVVFSSKRDDGLFTRLYLAHLDEAGRFSKPFVIPQEDPDTYSRCLMNYNRPELIREPVRVSPAELARAINTARGRRTLAVPAPDTPWQRLR